MGGINNSPGFWGVAEQQVVGMYTCPQGYCDEVGFEFTLGSSFNLYSLRGYSDVTRRSYIR